MNKHIRDAYDIESDEFTYDEILELIKQYGRNAKGSKRGSLITKDALYRAGEAGLNEAILP